MSGKQSSEGGGEVPFNSQMKGRKKPKTRIVTEKKQKR